MASKGSDTSVSHQFNLIIEQAEPKKHTEIAAEFSRAFSLSPAFAEQILKVLPVVFLEKLTKAEVKVIMSRLVDVSKKGVEFRLTAREPKGLPRVEWPVRPINPFGWGGSEGDASIHAGESLMTCPSCGKSFLLQSAEGIEFHAEGAKTGRRGASTAQAPTASSQGFDSEELSIQEELRPIEGGGIGDLDEPDLIPIDELPLDDDDPLQDTTRGETSAPGKPSVRNGPRFNVFLSKISAPRQKEDASKILAEVKGISIGEARQLADKTIIPVVKDVSKDEAEKILGRFEKIKVPGHINSAAG